MREVMAPLRIRDSVDELYSRTSARPARVFLPVRVREMKGTPISFSCRASSRISRVSPE